MREAHDSGPTGSYATMGRTLRYLGLAILAATAWLLIGDAAGWLPDGSADRWARTGAVLGAACLAAGLVGRLLSPVRREIHRGHCARCGAAIERGQTYCRDHLQAALNEIRDQTRDRLMNHSAPSRGSGSSSS